MQRGLVMDFPGDYQVRSISDEFMWGDAFLVAPVYIPSVATQGKQRASATRSVYLPATPGLKTTWVHFHSGEQYAPGTQELNFQIDEAPVLARSGSIVLLGPYLQHTGESQDPVEVRIYRGSDAQFALFEDDGNSRNYQSGAATTIVFNWREEADELTIGARDAHFAGMLATRTFSIVWVTPGHGVGVAPESHPDQSITYTGEQVVVKRQSSSVYTVI